MNRMYMLFIYLFVYLYIYIYIYIYTHVFMYIYIYMIFQKAMFSVRGPSAGIHVAVQQDVARRPAAQGLGGREHTRIYIYIYIERERYR